MKKYLSLLLALLLCLPAGLCRAEYYCGDPVAVGDTVISPATLEKAAQYHLICGALSSAAIGKSYPVTDSISIVDAMSKALFDLEQQIVICAEAEKMGLGELTPEEEAQLSAQAEAEMAKYRAVVFSENGMAFLPAGDYEPVEDDPEETVTRYLASWGLTIDRLFDEEYIYLLETKMQEKVTAHMQDATEDERIDYYTDWILARTDEAGIKENALSVAEVCLALKGD